MLQIKTVYYKNSELKLYSIELLSEALRVNAATIRNLEKKETIPKPMFKESRNRYYTLYEILAAANAFSTWPCNRRKRYELLNKYWGDIRKSLSIGGTVDYPIILKFNTWKSLKSLLESKLRPLGVVSDQFFEALTNDLIIAGIYE